MKVDLIKEKHVDSFFVPQTCLLTSGIRFKLLKLAKTWLVLSSGLFSHSFSISYYPPFPGSIEELKFSKEVSCFSV